MGRAKLPIRLINSDRSRHTTFTKRKRGLKKKIFEFATLCDVDACMIIYGSATGSTPETWPEDPAKVRQIIEKFGKASAEERNKRRVDISGFLSSKIKKLQGELEKKKAENTKLVSLLLWNRTNLEAMDLDKVLELENCLHAKIKAINERIDNLHGKDLENQGSPSEMPIKCELSQDHLSLYVPLLQYNYNIPSSFIVSPLESLPQGGNGGDLPGAPSGQGKDMMDPFLFRPVPDYSKSVVDPVLDHYSYVDPISSFLPGTYDSVPYVDPISGFLPGTYDSVPFSFSVTEDLDPLTGLLGNSDPIQGFEN